MAIIFIGLGSNEGNSLQILREAAFELKKNLGILLKSSSLYETAPWGFESERPFLNGAIKFETEHQPSEVLNMLHYLEAKAGRKRLETSEYTDRTLDLDLLYYDDLLSDEVSIQVPHPRIAQRNFVLFPLAEIDPDWLDARMQKTVREMLLEVKDLSEIKILHETWM